MTKLNDLAQLGQSIWLDYIRRDMLTSQELHQLVAMGVRGVTSNPSIFQQAITGSDAYEDSLHQLASEGRTPMEIYEALAIDDIQRAADVFRSLYNQTEGADGYVSLEVNPEFANDTEATIAEARRLFALIDRPNVYIKVPATPAGIPAIEQLIGEGINVNVTLIFSRELYDQIIEAYMRGLETLISRGGNPRDVSSVASFFVSRVDSNVDARLDAMGVTDVRGKAGIANAKLAYQLFLERFAGERWERLAARGARLQRPLWASTSTKDPAYSDTMYVDELIGPNTVNTVPPHTLEAILDHGRVEITLTKGIDEARAVLARLEELGISIDAVTAELLEEGIAKFAEPFRKLITAIAEERDRILRDVEAWDYKLGQYDMAVRVAARKLADDDVLRRMWARDYTLWSDSPDEITNRLGWLTIARTMADITDELRAFAAEVRGDGYDKVVLLGMGGSSLAPELFARTFGPAPGYPELLILDSTDPLAVTNVRKHLDPQRTLFVVSSKSGSTVETISFFKYFYTWMTEGLDGEAVGDHFVAISDPGSPLMALASRYQFRAAFANDPNIGGRYSALSHFGLVPAALLGIDLDELLARAQRIDGPEAAEKAGFLGAVLGTLAQDGRDRVSFITTPNLAGFGDWVEQLIAESTGKKGRGILPIVGEGPLPPEAYTRRQKIVYLRLLGDEDYDEQVAEIADELPVITITLRDRYDIAEQFVVWEIATAVAGQILGINPFNQPNVESAKVRARALLDAAAGGDTPAGRRPPTPVPSFSDGPAKVYEAHLPADNAAQALDNFLELAHADSYIAVQAYAAPTAENDAALVSLRNYLRQKAGVPVTVGYGPRFLHSTGQLHKGDAGDGLFIQLTTEAVPDVPIPDEPGEPASSLTFGILKMAQALGDAEALKEAGRPVIRFHSASNRLAPLVTTMQR
ncbi:MAG: bifunctional transaldolase/phosoglucose isomerase [Chloroflexi bacterium]|nr:bifunctional transaldolase/phosoglucose isomerase [Chloroflexota bacterium]